ncbi:lytic transglycosylase [Bacterioplanes sanyensis]|uniref:Lytic transglycosylase n=1 Tax=Bacterioplanes sanyensis TaxID=1249553 RepID=A0A222FMG5_9GAMM|nr:LysM peptidoglycan-binding domain-containing protein [Bacterioplanes sanyensis]ASP39714.1 lytic transglycosylase [Bacterioplanes sanyensis]
MRFIKLWLLAGVIGGCAQHPQQNSPVAPSVAESPLNITEQQATDATPQQHNDVWDRILASYRLNIDQDQKRITSQLNWYKSHQAYLDRVADRSRRYLYFIAEQIEARNMPGELALLPIVESAFDPFAYSHGRAAGVWQFIPSTGRDFDLHQDWWHDGRRDIRASTEAALSYLDALQRQFDGDWLLGLAAYNSGAGTVRKAIRKNRRLGKPTDFWSLQLPRETRAYVPKLIALARLLRDAEKYNIQFKPVANQPYFAVVNTGGQIDLSQVAQLADTELEEIYKLNPVYNRWATRPQGPHEILVPYEKKDTFNKNLAQLPESARLKWQRYVVRSGDSLISIAKRFHTTPDALRQSNQLRGNMIRKGQALLIPSAMQAEGSYAYSAPQRLERLKQQRKPSNSNHSLRYRVQSGDSFWSIARAHDVSVRQLTRWNGLAPGDPLKPGQTLTIWTKKQTPAQREVIRTVHYKVRSGDSLARIASKFNVRLADVKRWNRQLASNKYLQPGQRLTLYVDVTR